MTQLEFLETVSPFRDRMFRVAKRLLHSEEEAADATQEILLKLWIGKNQISNYKNVEAYAMTMMRNFCLDRLKSKSASNVSLEHDNYAVPGADLSLKLEEQDQVNWVGALLSALPETQRRIFQLRDLEAYNYGEIEAIMNMNATAVRVALSRARKSIREQLIKKDQYGLREN